MPNCSYVSTPGHPRLPVRSVVIKLPLKSSIIGLNVKLENVTLEETYYIVPSATPIPLLVHPPSNDTVLTLVYADKTSNYTLEPDPVIYGSDDLYPKEWFLDRVGNGLDPETSKRVKYVLVYFYPLRYMPKQKKIIWAKNASVTIHYRYLTQEAFLSEKLDNIIITSPLFEGQALRLAEWKNSTGIVSRVLNTNWIYRHYAGIDHPEQIRNCIKDFVSTYGIGFVTIFGDADRVPVRNAYVPDGYETFVPTDLYYADLDYTWDDNGDGLYADIRYDRIDGIPDVYVGRIPPSLEEYADVAVNKIMNYKQFLNVSEDWFNRALFVSGNPNNPFPTGLDFAYLKDYVATWTTKEVIRFDKPWPDTLISELNKGQAFVNFAGHGDPGSWLLDWFLWIFPITFTGSHAFGLTNGLKLPVVTAMSCSTARFDDQESIGEYFVLNPNGGSIAYFGATRIAWGYAGEDIIYGLMGEMDWRVYQAFYEGYSALGEMWGVSTTKYIESHGLYDIYDEKTLMEFILLGDPTLRISAPIYAEIYTDKGCYKSGEAMNLGLKITNFGVAVDVGAKIWVETPTGETRIVFDVPFIRVPADLRYSNPAFRTYVLPSLPEGIYLWHVALYNSITGTTITEDTSYFKLLAD